MKDINAFYLSNISIKEELFLPILTYRGEGLGKAGLIDKKNLSIL